MSCQLTDIHEPAKKNSCLNDLFDVRVKILRSLKRNLIFVKNKLFRIFRFKRKVQQEEIADKSVIGHDDLVRVRPKDEIRRMLDDHGRYSGCLFIDEMYEHCCKTFRVLKTITFFFDEAEQKMCKCKDIVILEGVTCSGRQRLYTVNCDRNCFFFWHTAWLEKMERG